MFLFQKLSQDITRPLRIVKQYLLSLTAYMSYDNSVDGEEAKIQFRLTNGVMGKMYVTDMPEWAQAILPDTEN